VSLFLKHEHYRREPFLRNDLLDILGEVKKQGFKIYLLTNGTLLDNERARMLADLGVDGVQVSMEGPEDVHDAIRGAGSYSASAAGVEQLVDAGIAVTLNVTISNLNAGQVKRIITFGSHAGVKRVGFSRLVPAGRGRALLSHAHPAQVKGSMRSSFSGAQRHRCCHGRSRGGANENQGQGRCGNYGDQRLCCGCCWVDDTAERQRHPLQAVAPFARQCTEGLFA
jgi:molybdenum cofactor biosynthesis enzyme MoaA